MMTNASMMNDGHFGDGDVVVPASIVVMMRKRGSGYCWMARLPGVPVSALRKDLVIQLGVAGRSHLCVPVSALRKAPWDIQCNSKLYGSGLTN